MKINFIKITGLAFLTIALNSCDSSSDSVADNLDNNPTNQNQPNSPSQSNNPPSQNPGQSGNNTNNQTADARESEMAALITGHSMQNRTSMRLDPILSKVARERAEDLAARRYFSHTNPDGFGPNALVTQEGYTLPSFYSSAMDGNNIESIAAGNSAADATLLQWINSAGHRRHVFAEIPFYLAQTDYGIGYAADPSSPFRFYWVFLSARR